MRELQGDGARGSSVRPHVDPRSQVRFAAILSVSGLDWTFNVQQVDTMGRLLD